MAGPRPKRSSYTPTSKPIVANIGRTFSIPGPTSRRQGNDTNPGRSQSKAGVARFQVNQQTGAPKSKTR